MNFAFKKILCFSLSYVDATKVIQSGSTPPLRNHSEQHGLNALDRRGRHAVLLAGADVRRLKMSKKLKKIN